MLLALGLCSASAYAQGITDPLDPCLTGVRICPIEDYEQTDVYILGGRDASHEASLNPDVKVGACDLISRMGKVLMINGVEVASYPGPATGGMGLLAAIQNHSCF